MAGLAIKLLWLSVALDAIGTFLLWQQIQSDPSRSIVVPVIGWLLIAWVISRIAAGRTWARVVLLLLVVLEVAAIFVVPGTSDLMFANSNFQGLVTVATIALQAVGIVILFIPGGFLNRRTA